MKSLKITSAFLAFVIASLLLLSGCGKSSEPMEYTLSVWTEGGLAAAGLRVDVYLDKELTDLVWAAETDSDGKTSFTGKADTVYYAKISELPTGYNASESYEIKSDHTNIVLDIELLDEGALSNTTLKLGDVACDFTVIDVNGKEHKLSELLETKKAVILNFWFINCGPCKMEFPYLENAYSQYADSVEVIAINPLDGTNASISAYAEDNSLTFPMATGSSEWISAFNLNAYPTTVVIDRYGTIAMMHTGSITGDGEFEKIIEYFTADKYAQTTIRNISDID